MKTFATSLFFLGFIILSNAQTTNNSESMIELEDVLVTNLNSDYLETMQDKTTPKTVASLQRKAAGYNVQNCKDFDKNQSRAFEVLFTNNRGRINAFYDANGRITSTIESFKNVPLPVLVRQEIHNSNANWEMIENSYSGAYNNKKLIKRNYRILLKNGDDTKRIVINSLK